MPRLKKIIFALIPPVLFILVFGYDVIRSAVNLGVSAFDIAREIIIVVAFFVIYLFIEGGKESYKRAITKNIGGLLIACSATLVIAGCISLFSFVGSGARDGSGMGSPVLGTFFSVILGVVFGILSIRSLFTIKDLVLFKRTKGAKRNYMLYLILVLSSAASVLPFFPVGLSFVGSLLFSLAVGMIVVNAFKQNWIVYLSRREKIYVIIYSALLFAAFMILNVMFFEKAFANKALLAFSQPVHRFTQLNAVFGAVYFGMAFVSTLFHLPTAEVFERKQFEITSLHNLTRLVAQVLDFDDLVNTVTQMTLEVCGAKSAWLELIGVPDHHADLNVRVVSQKNITREQIEAIAEGEGSSLRGLVVESKKFLLIDDVLSDRRTNHVKEKELLKGSLVSIPLLSHGELIGILHATKEFEYGFDQDDIDVLTTFADNVTIAIENSKLIAKSIERERLQQEMLVAQTMQRRLLPESPPKNAMVDIAAVSESSMEVGGDYYDFVELDEDRIGVVVGDVSGKGVSAALYMAEVKGIFLSLSKLCSSPRDLIIKANETLIGSLEKKAFISLIYAIVDVRNATLAIARAGHCPVIYISRGGTELIRPSGLGLGLTNSEIFVNATEERVLQLNAGDVCIFYTDGITESRNPGGEEFGYDRLVDVANRSRTKSSDEIKNQILNEVRDHAGEPPYGDDMTLVVIKWIGTLQARQRENHAYQNVTL